MWSGWEDSGLDAIEQDNALFGVDFFQAHFDDFGIAGLDRAADVLGFNGHFAMAAVNEHAKGDALGAAEIEETVHGGAHCASGIEDVVDEDEFEAIDAKRNVGGLKDRLRRDFGEIVAVQRDIESADGDVNAVDAAHGVGDAFGERNAAAADADEREMARAAAFLDDLVSEALQGAVDLGGGHQLGFFDELHVGVMLAQVKRGRMRRTCEIAW